MEIITNYADLPVGKYLDIVKVDEDVALDTFDKQVRIIALLANATPDAIRALDIDAYSELAAQSRFLEVAPPALPPARLVGVYRVGGLELVPVTDFRKLNVGQYVDFQAFAKQPYANIVEILSVFLVPKGKTYGDGYDIADVQTAIRDNMTVSEVYSLQSFFLTSWVSSIEASLSSLAEEVKIMQPGERKDRTMMEIQRCRMMLTSLRGVGGGSGR